MVDFALAHVGDRPFELKRLEIGQRDRRQNLKFDGIGEIRLAGDQFLDCALLLRKRHLRLDGELEAVIGDDLAVGFAHGRFDDLGHCRLAVQAAQMLHRNLAGPEPAELHATLEVIEPLIDARFQIGRRHDDAIFALEACGSGLGHLHRQYSCGPQ